MSDALTRLLDAHAAAQMRAHHERLDREAFDLFWQGYRIDELTVVYSPLYPHGRVMTKAQAETHGVEVQEHAGYWVALT